MNSTRGGIERHKILPLDQVATCKANKCHLTPEQCEFSSLFLDDPSVALNSARPVLVYQNTLDIAMKIDVITWLQAKEMRKMIQALRDELRLQATALREAKEEVERLILRCAPSLYKWIEGAGC